MPVIRPVLVSFISIIMLMVGGSLSAQEKSIHPYQKCLSSTAYQNFPNSEILVDLSRGFNLPNWDEPDHGNRPRIHTLKTLRNLGMSHVRLPVFHESFMHGLADGLAVRQYLDQARSMIRLLIDIGYVVSVDLHPGFSFNSLYDRDPEAGLQRLMKIWNTVSEGLQEFDPRYLLVELLNEPYTDEETWRRHAPQLVDAIRENLPHHTIVMGSAGPQRFETLSAMEPLSDRNVVYAMHYYDPFFFTHQGAEWLEAGDPIMDLRELPFPIHLHDPLVIRLMDDLKAQGKVDTVRLIEKALQAPWEIKDLEEGFDRVAAWAKKHEKIIIANEFGVLSHHAIPEARQTWIGAVRLIAEERCIGWTHWDYSQGFGFVDYRTGTIDPVIINRLLGNNERR